MTDRPSDDPLRQNIIDHEHLRMLSIGYLVSAGVSGFYALFGLMYALMGGFVGAVSSRIPTPAAQEPFPEAMGWVFAIFGFTWFAVMLALGVLKFMAYRRLKERRSRSFCMLVAAVSCLGVPYGTVLGVFTFILLSRPSVVRLFGIEPPPFSASSASAGGG